MHRDVQEVGVAGPELGLHHSTPRGAPSPISFSSDLFHWGFPLRAAGGPVALDLRSQGRCGGWSGRGEDRAAGRSGLRAGNFLDLGPTNTHHWFVRGGGRTNGSGRSGRGTAEGGDERGGVGEARWLWVGWCCLSAGLATLACVSRLHSVGKAESLWCPRGVGAPGGAVVRCKRREQSCGDLVTTGLERAALC